MAACLKTQLGRFALQKVNVRLHMGPRGWLGGAEAKAEQGVLGHFGKVTARASHGAT